MLGEKRARESHPSRCEQFYASIIKVGHAIWRGWSAKGRVPLKAASLTRVLRPRWRGLAVTRRRSCPFVSPRRARLRAPATRPNIVLSSRAAINPFFFFILTLPPRVRGTINGGLLLLSFSCSKDRCFLSFISFHLNPVIRFRVCAWFLGREILRKCISDEWDGGESFEATLKIINSCQLNELDERSVI